MRRYYRGKKGRKSIEKKNSEWNHEERINTKGKLRTNATVAFHNKPILIKIWYVNINTGIVG